MVLMYVRHPLSFATWKICTSIAVNESLADLVDCKHHELINHRFDEAGLRSLGEESGGVDAETVVPRVLFT